MKISVIVPVYKVEKYLDECIQSVFDQTYTNLEIILVNDGSPDNCPVICDKYAEQDARIRVIHKENGGLSDARNAGLKEATGDYVVFLDSDDYWGDNNLLYLLTKELEKDTNVDLILFERNDYYESTGKFVVSKGVDLEQVNDCELESAFEYLIKNQKLNISACLKLIKRELLISHQIHFEKGLLGEDMDWSLQLWSKVQLVRAINCFGYVYRHRSDSITTNYGLKNVEDFVLILHKWYEIALTKINNSSLSKLYLGYIAFLFPTLIRNFFLVPIKDRKSEYKLLKGLLPLLAYSITKKSNQISVLNKYLGFKVTILLVGIASLLNKRGLKGLLLLFK